MKRSYLVFPVAVALLALTACGEKNPYCKGPTRMIYDPPSGDPNTFPDDYYTLDDPTTITGLRVHMIPGENVVIPETISDYAPTFHDMSTLDGFGTTADINLRFSGSLDASTFPVGGEGSGNAAASVVLVNMDSDPPEFVDFMIRQVPEHSNDPSINLLISPIAPLRPKTRYGVAVTTRVKDPNGKCVAPSSTMRSLLDGSAKHELLRRIRPQVKELIDLLVAAGTISNSTELSAAVTFTTQSTWETSAEVARQIRENTFTYRSLGPCTDRPFFRECEGEFDAEDYRVDFRAVDDAAPSPQRTYTLKVTTYLPLTGAPPFPTAIFGHGLVGSRHQADDLAEFAAQEGLAPVSIDAVLHGDHPEPLQGPESLRALEFFGLSLDMDPPLDAIKLRDNFRQSTYDKLQLLEMLRPGVDITGDATPDVGIDNLFYVGASLGGLMSTEFLALAPEVKAALIIVPGAEVGSIIQYSETFGVIVEIFRGLATDGQVLRFFPLLQAVIDRGDPAAYAGHILVDRLPGFDQQAPHVLVQMVLDDEIVPNISNIAYAQSLGAPLVGDELFAIPGLPHGPALPASANTASGMTAGVFQFDVIVSDDGTTLEPATHDNVARSTVAVDQSMYFIRTFLDTGTAVLVDPYRRLGIKP